MSNKLKPTARAFFGKENISYTLLNREERNLAAIFYHCLNLGDNLNRLFEHLSSPFPFDNEQYGIYFEYAYLRDLWESVGLKDPANDQKRGFILACLPEVAEFDLANASIEAFNTFFGVAGTPSKQYIQSPSNWSISKYHPSLKATPEALLAVSKFKWCFNAKPDIVIHTDLNHALVIEAKDVSAEGTYPGSDADKRVFREAGLEPNVKQTDIQKHIMALLGVEMKGYLLSTRVIEPVNGYTNITWRQAFDAMDTSNLPAYMKARIALL